MRLFLYLFWLTEQLVLGKLASVVEFSILLHPLDTNRKRESLQLQEIKLSLKKKNRIVKKY